MLCGFRCVVLPLMQCCALLCCTRGTRSLSAVDQCSVSSTAASLSFPSTAGVTVQNSEGVFPWRGCPERAALCDGSDEVGLKLLFMGSFNQSLWKMEAFRAPLGSHCSFVPSHVRE